VLVVGGKEDDEMVEGVGVGSTCSPSDMFGHCDGMVGNGKEGKKVEKKLDKILFLLHSDIHSNHHHD